MSHNGIGLVSPLITRLGLRGYFFTSTDQWLSHGLSAWSEMVEALDKEPPYSRVIGVDIEWFLKNPVAVIQIASSTHCFVLHLSYFDNRVLPNPVKALLERHDVVKCGVNIKGDQRKLFNDCSTTIEPVMNVEEYAEMLSSVGVGNHSLKSLSEILVGLEMPFKSKNIARSNWELPLSFNQLQYAADDAVASFAVGRFLARSAVEMQCILPDPANEIVLVDWLRRTQNDAARQLKSVQRQHNKEMREAASQKKIMAASEPLSPEQKVARLQANIPVTVVDKDEKFLFKCNQSQAKFYTVDRGIAEVLEFHKQTHKPSKIKLLFDPRRKSRLCVYHAFQLPCTDGCPFAHGLDDLVPESRRLLEDLTPSCAICLSLRGLIRQAVVPPSFRRYLPGKWRIANEDDYLPICRQCQTAIVDKVKSETDRLCQKAKDTNSLHPTTVSDVGRWCSIARLLMKTPNPIPPQKREEMARLLAENVRSLGLLGNHQTPPPQESPIAEGQPPPDTPLEYPLLSHDELSKVAQINPNELHLKAIINVLVGDDEVKAEEFVQGWWSFYRAECAVLDKPSNHVVAEQWKEIKSRKELKKEATYEQKHRHVIGEEIHREC